MLLRGPRRRSHQSRTSGNDFWNRYVFSRWRNRVNEGDDWISDGRVFHRVDAATGNDRRPRGYAPVSHTTHCRSSPTPVSDNCVLPTLEHSLSVGRAAVLETGPLPPHDHKSGTVCHPISDYVGCYMASSGSYWRNFIRTVRPRRSVNCFNCTE